MTALLSGKALTAMELAIEADIAASTASSHLNQLLEGELLHVRKQGRHKYFQLADQKVAALLEQLLNVSATLSHPKAATGPNNPRLRQARVCYDHLAGTFGVALYDSLMCNHYIIERDNDTLLTNKGQLFFNTIDNTIFTSNTSKQPQCKACLDWSERRSHMAGQLGKWMLTDLLGKKWATRDLDSRAIQFTQQGLILFSKRYNISC
ncbi:ArsR/SmtB family transcription factor [Shewanella surugensis]|uniref:Helix-turn-helix domain-containing protein n=1 Tax=Shewanella surugensis TaxID=212020 RepID=A0ABT0L9Q1_9GAMM|nr:helix-turn-helix domain-containing protein [Shewanella surugensis]MCL1124077.1 helix-turn-helix domain-containing protein [Shewanella surugensis]